MKTLNFEIRSLKHKLVRNDGTKHKVVGQLNQTPIRVRSRKKENDTLQKNINIPAGQESKRKEAKAEGFKPMRISTRSGYKI